MSDKFLTTEEAMRALKVSRVTLYRWAKSGKIPFTKTGGTYRFKKDDIDKFLSGQPTDGTKADGTVAPSRHPLVVSGRDIEIWASHGNRVAEEILPELVRRLIQASRKEAGVSELHIPSGDSVGQPGWDGKVLAAKPHIYIPAGVSAWEMGIGEPQNKATSDYTKRTEKPLNIIPEDSTLVFVSAQRWPEKDKWTAKKLKDGKWSNIRVIDADDLEAWLETSPAVKRWFMSILGRTQTGVIDLETYWEDWRSETAPPLTSALVIADRIREVKSIQKKLINPTAGAFIVQAKSKAEATAFVAASVSEMKEEDNGTVLASTLVITSQEAWDSVVASTESLILIAMFDNPEKLSSAISKGHTVIVPSDASAGVSEEGVILNSPKRESVKKNLLEMGLQEKRADNLSLLGRHSLLSLWRRLAVVGSVQKPEWTKDANLLIPALLIGRWDENSKADKDAVAGIASMSYEDYAAKLNALRLNPDSPIGKVGSKWYVASKEDVWDQIGNQITQGQVDRFASFAKEALSEINPAYDMPSSERWMANIEGKKLAHSSDIRASLADTLAFLSVARADKKIGDVDGELLTSAILQDVFKKAEEDKTCHLWATLSSLLPLLAEAAPEQFLTSMERELKSSGDKLKFIFQDSDSNDIFGPSSPHTSFISAFEVMAWSLDFLLRSSYILCRLDELDPGGKYSNRPQASLKDIFLSWHPQTAATVEERIIALEAILSKYPKQGRQLLSDVLPEHHGSVTFGVHDPKWRDWKPDDITVTYAELYKYVDAITDMLIKSAGLDGKSWVEILDHYSEIPTDKQEAVVSALMALSLDDLSQDNRAAIWDKLRNIIYTNRRYTKQSWAMKKELVKKLEPVLARFEPDNPVDKYKWLFGHHPDLPLVDEDNDKAWEKYEIAVGDARKDAAIKIYESSGIEALLEISPKVDSQHHLGVAVGQTDILSVADFEKVFGLLSADGALNYFARGVVVGKFYPNGWAWAKDVIKNSKSLQDPKNLAAFLNLLPLSVETWKYVDASSEEVQNLYWQNVSAYGLVEEDQYSRLAEETIKAGRPYTAIEALSLYVERADSKPEPDLILRALEGFIKSNPKIVGKVDMSMFTHHSDKLFEYLDKVEGLDETRLAQIEWALLPALKHGHKPKILYNELAKNPEFFAEIITWIYRKRGAKKEKLTKEQEARARLGYELLDSWNVIPGKTNGVVDEEKLWEWVEKARELLEKSGRLVVGDQHIGKILTHSPTDDDGAWPIVAVRNVLERVESDDVEQGFRLAVYNGRGVSSRAVGEGGGQERALAAKYEEYAKKVKFRWPHTAYTLLEIAATWRREAERHDNDALEDEIA